jgi:Transmembrane protein 43
MEPWEEPPGQEPDESHVYQETTVVSWGRSLLGSLIALFFGVLLFFGSFVLLFANEGSIDVSRLARSAEVITATTPAAQTGDKMVALTGTIGSSQPLGDNLYLKPGAYITLVRTVEMFAWKQTVSTRTQRNFGGSETQVKTYRYTHEWTDKPEDSSLYKEPNYINPPKPIENQILKVPAAQIGAYTLDMANLNEIVNFPYSCTTNARRYTSINSNGISLPPNDRLNLTPQMLLPSETKAIGSYLFQGAGTPQVPKVGDLRICYAALPTGSTVTVFGQLQENRLTPMPYQDQAFFRLAYGSREPAIADLRSEYLGWLWFFRLLGFVLMWGGLLLLAEPISVLLSVVPLLGDLVDLFTGVASFAIAVVLSFVTIVVSSLVHQPIVLVGSVVVTLIVLFIGKMLRRAH